MAVRARTHLVNKSGQSLKKNLLYQASDLGMLLRLALPTEGSISIWVQGSGLGFRAGSRRAALFRYSWISDSIRATTEGAAAGCGWRISESRVLSLGLRLYLNSRRPARLGIWCPDVVCSFRKGRFLV